MEEKNTDGYQVESRQSILKTVSELVNFKPKLAIDIGANVGFWTKDFCETFEKVIAFEPIPSNVECLKKNVPNTNLEIKEYALGARKQDTDIFFPQNGNSGSATFSPSNLVDESEIQKVPTKIRTLDDELVNVSEELAQNCLIKIDVQGYEKEDDGIYWGMADTIMLKDQYTQADKDEKKRIRESDPVVDGEVVMIEGKPYKAYVLGDFSNCVVFDPA